MLAALLYIIIAQHWLLPIAIALLLSFRRSFTKLLLPLASFYGIVANYAKIKSSSLSLPAAAAAAAARDRKKQQQPINSLNGYWNKANRFVATRLRLRQLNVSQMAKATAKLRVFLALMMICKVAVFLECLGVIVCIAVGTSGFAINQSTPDFHFASCIITGAVVLGLLIFDFFCLRKSVLSQWLALSEIILPALVMIMLLPSSTLAVGLFNCSSLYPGSDDERQALMLTVEQRALYTKQYCYSTGIAGVLGFLNAWWLFINICLACYAYKTSWESFLQQRLQAGTAVVGANGDIDANNNNVVNEPLNRRPKVVMGEDTVAMR